MSWEFLAFHWVMLLIVLANSNESPTLLLNTYSFLKLSKAVKFFQVHKNLLGSSLHPWVRKLRWFKTNLRLNQLSCWAKANLTCPSWRKKNQTIIFHSFYYLLCKSCPRSPKCQIFFKLREKGLTFWCGSQPAGSCVVAAIDKYTPTTEILWRKGDSMATL